MKTPDAKQHTAILSKIYGSRQDDAGKSHGPFMRGLLMILFVVVSMLLLFTSCEEPIPEMSATHDFVIRNGERYASPRLFERFESQKLAFTAKFDESAVYVIDDATAQSDKNILMGFTDCGSLYTENSADFTWRWVDARLEIYAHSFANGTPTELYLGVVPLNEKNTYEIVVTEGQYVFYINGEQKTAFERLSDCDQVGNYILFPYFGERLPAPHNIKLEIEMLSGAI